jgi:hypothetical protein
MVGSTDNLQSDQSAHGTAPNNSSLVSLNRVPSIISYSGPNWEVNEGLSGTELVQEGEKRLNAAVEHLREVMEAIPAKSEEIDLQQIRQVADINCVQELKNSRAPVKVFVDTWFKASMPFITKSLEIAKVRMHCLDTLV